MKKLGILYIAVVTVISALFSEDQCFNVTCDALAGNECVSTSDNDKTIKLNSVYCSNGTL